MIIITGGAGFIGSCLLAKLNANGINNILVVDNLGAKNKWKNLANKKFMGFLHKNKFRELFLQNDNQILHLDFFNEKHIEAIIHLGACSATTEKNADYLLDNNFLYSQELAKFALNNDIRFIYASSAATYGNGENGYSDNSTENLLPLNCYGLSKHLFDMWVTENNFAEKVTGIKFFNVFGPNEYHKGNMRSMFLKSFEQIEKTGKVQLFKSNRSNYANGEQKRDFIYVKDCVEIIFKMLTDKNFTGLYNFGTGLARSWNDLANAVFIAMNKSPRIEYVDIPKSLAGQYQYFTEADTTKLLAKLGKEWKFTSIESAAEDYIQNYLTYNKYW